MSELAAPAQPRALDGASSFAAGARFVVLRPSSWRYAIVPVIAAVCTTLALAVPAVWGASKLAEGLAALLGIAADGTAATVFRVVLSVAMLPLVALVGVALAQPLSGPALDDLARTHEAALGGVVRPDGPLLDGVLRGLRVTLTSLAVALPVLGLLTVVELFVPPAMVVTLPLKFAVTALLVAWDMLDYPLSQRQMGVRARLAWMRANLGAAFSFGAMAALVLLVPGAGLFVLPIGVAGATHLVVRRERALPEKVL